MFVYIVVYKTKIMKNKEEKSFHQLMKELEFSSFSIQYGILINQELELADETKGTETIYCKKIGYKNGLKKAFEIFKQLKDEKRNIS